jgi:hypothetical protein
MQGLNQKNVNGFLIVYKKGTKLVYLSSVDKLQIIHES